MMNLIDVGKLKEYAQVMEKLEHKIYSQTGLSVKIVAIPVSNNENAIIQEETNEEEIILKAIEFVALKNEVTPAELIHSDTWEMARIRAITTHLLKDTFPKISLKKIGQKLNNRDHSTMSHGMKQFDKRWQAEPKFRNAYVQLKNDWKTLIGIEI